MWWDRVLSWFGAKPDPPSQQLPELTYLSPDKNPWKVRLLDVRPVTLGMLSASTNLKAAENNASFGNEDGICFIGQSPTESSRATIHLEYPVDSILADGVLFSPRAMEDKWAIFFHGGELIFVRSWTRQVDSRATIAVNGGVASITSVQGGLAGFAENDGLCERLVDYLIRSHALHEAYPVPLMSELMETPPMAAMTCMSMFGRQAHFATDQVISRQIPHRVLRTHSLLHIATAKGDTTKVAELLQQGLRIDLLASDGLAPLHWSLAREDTQMMSFLLANGSPVDVRSEEGATPLMNAVQARSLEKVALLLTSGADSDARDHRGFTSLHRAAEMGETAIVTLLLKSGANPEVSAEGLTPKALAEARGHSEIVKLLQSR